MIASSKFAKKDDLSNLKSEVGKLDNDKLEKAQSCLRSLKSKVDKLDFSNLAPGPSDISKLRNIVKMYIYYMVNQYIYLNIGANVFEVGKFIYMYIYIYVYIYRERE